MFRYIWSSLCHWLAGNRFNNRVINVSTDALVNPPDNETSTFPLEVIVVPSNEAIIESTTPLEVKVVSSNEGIIDSRTSLEVKVLPSNEGIIECRPPLEVIEVPSNEAIIESRTPLEVKVLPSNEGIIECRPPLEVIVVPSNEGIIKSTPPLEVKVVPSHEGKIECTTPLEVNVVPSDEGIIESTIPLGVNVVSSKEPIIESDIISDFTTGIEQGDASEGSFVKNLVHLIVTSIAFTIFGILLLFIDMGLVVMDSLLTKSELHIPVEYRMISLAIGIYFFIDVVLRVYIEGKKYYFSDLLNIFDTVIIAITFLIDVASIFFYSKSLKDIPRVAVIFQPIRLITLLRVFHLANQKRHLEQSTRRLVSGNKRRYSKESFDLDLTYITGRIIAMSFPSCGRQSFYRNPIEEVVRFLDTKHFGHYFVYNLCREKSYDSNYFHNRVDRISIEDHNPPTLEEMIWLSREVTDWLAKDPQNVVAIHCKGGKGRTGTMICACLIATGVFSTAEESLQFFGNRRTGQRLISKFQGVETPSQSRYVGYFETLKNVYNLNLPVQKTLKIEKIILYSIHGVGRGDGTDLTVEIVMQQKTVFTCTSQTCTVLHDKETDRVIFVIPDCPDLCGDVKVKFLSPFLPKGYDDCAFFFLFNTSFTKRNRLYLSRQDLDNPHKPKLWNIYRPDFAVELNFK